MTWIDIPANSPFGPDTLPLGIFRRDGEQPRLGAAVGDSIIDLAPVAAARPVDGSQTFAEPTLNAFLALGRPAWHATREWLLDLVRDENNRAAVEPHLIRQSDVTMEMPFEVADYVDFYASEQHATNLGRLFRPDSEPLLPNWKHLPVGYHGRAGTVVASGTDIVRPSGQRKAPAETAPTYGPSQRLDIEVEPRLRRREPVDARRAGLRRELQGPRVRRCRGQRLVGEGPAGVGVRATRAVPGQVVRHLDLALGRLARGARGHHRAAARAGADRPAVPGKRLAGELRHHLRGVLERRAGQQSAVQGHVLVTGPDACSPVRQRRLGPDRRSVCLRHRFGSGEGPARLLHRASAGAVASRSR